MVISYGDFFRRLVGGKSGGIGEAVGRWLFYDDLCFFLQRHMRRSECGGRDGTRLIDNAQVR